MGLGAQSAEHIDRRFGLLMIGGCTLLGLEDSSHHNIGFRIFENDC